MTIVIFYTSDLSLGQIRPKFHEKNGKGGYFEVPCFAILLIFQLISIHLLSNLVWTMSITVKLKGKLKFGKMANFGGFLADVRSILIKTDKAAVRLKII